MLKISQFTVCKSLEQQGLSKHSILYSTSTDKSLVLKTEDWRKLTSGLDSLTEVVPGGALDKLRARGLLVDKNKDENEEVLRAFDKKRWKPQKIYPILAITTGCNIGCTYCYEKGASSSTMSATTADAVADWVVQRMDDDGVSEIHPSLFGGEPLMYPDLMFRIMDRVNAGARRAGVEVTFSSSSNGLFMTTELARKLFAHRMTQIQISLDGTQGVHNIRRLGKRGQSTYDGSLAGLEAAARYIPNVTLKVNFDRQNMHDLPEMFSELAKSGLNQKVDVKLEAIAYQFSTSKVVHRSEFVIPPETEEMAEAYAMLQLQAEAAGFVVRRDTAHTTPCMLTSNHGVIIGPDGAIYKCISLVGRSEFAVGSVFNDDYDLVPYEKQMDVRKKTKKCVEEKCSYLPVCFGGCAYESAVRGEDMNDRFCTYQNLDRYHFLQKMSAFSTELETLGASVPKSSNLCNCGGK